MISHIVTGMINKRTCIAVQRLIAVGPTLAAGKGVARGPTTEHVGRDDARERWDVPPAQCLLVSRVFKERPQCVHDCRYLG